MEMNQTPTYNTSVNTTGCCPRFNSEGWDGQTLHFRNKPFIRAKTRSLFHIPINMGSVFSSVQQALEKADAVVPEHTLVLSLDNSPWRAEHFFAVDRDVPDQDMATLSGEFVTRVFEGPYSQMRTWCDEMKAEVQARGRTPGRMFYFYTTCPKCARVYGKNYVVAVAELN